MNLQETLKKYKFSKSAASVILKSGIKDLYPPQAEAVKKGALSGNNILLSVPTAAGKTFVAELCMLKSILEHNGRCLYIAPLKALASEKFNEFNKKYESLGIKTGLAIGDYDSPVRFLNKYQIVVATAEKVDSLLRTKARWLIDSLSVVVLDEIHFINDASRGPTMEILIARIKQLNPKIQIVGLSATISNADELAEWLDASPIISKWRPIPLKEGVYFNERITFDDEGIKEIYEEASDDVSKLSMDTLRSDGQVLVFVNSRRSAQAVARQVSSSVSKFLKPEEKTELTALSKKILGNKSDSTKLCQKLADVVVHGCAFHHAGLKPKQRELIEDHFKKNIIKVIGCTPTLAAGVNLPARRAVIRDCKRFESGVGAAYIPTSEYKQCAGRAGRPQYDDYGEAVLVAKSYSESGTLFERYIQADPEPIFSKLSNESSLRIHILSSIAGGYVHDVNGMFEFIQHTFLYHQKQNPNLLDLISNIFDFLLREEFIKSTGYRYFATPLGSLTSRLYIDPLTSIMLRDGINLIDKNTPFTDRGMLHLIACSPDGPKLNVGKKDVDELDRFASHHADEWILNSENTEMLDDFYTYLSTLKTTWMLDQWVEEEKEDTICDAFNVGPGDVYRHTESTQWLLHAAGLISELIRKKQLTFDIENLRRRVRYGIKKELLDIIQLKGVGRIRARQLFQNGYKTMSDLKLATSDSLADIPQIGNALARDIVKQVHAPVRKRALPIKSSATNTENLELSEDWTN